MDTERTEKPSREELDRLLCDAYPDAKGLSVGQVLDVVAPLIDRLSAELDDTRAQLVQQRASNHAATRLIREHGDVEEALADKERENEQQWQTIESLRFELAQRDATIARVKVLRDGWAREAADLPLLESAADQLSAALGGEPETAEPASPEGATNG